MTHTIPHDIRRVLEAGNQAPSGENCQPWHFVLRGDTSIEVHLLTDRDASAYSWGQRGSYLACGAAIENMTIAASAEGYRADVAYFPHSSIAHVATITLARDPSIVSDTLTPLISQRISNRKPYRKDSLTSDESQALERAVADAGYGTLALAKERSDIDRLARIGSTNEEVMLADRTLHRFFFSHVNWSKKEDDLKKIGFYIKTLELPPPAQVLFRFFRYWPIMRIFNMVGFNTIIAAQNALTNAATGAIGALMIDGIEPIDFVKAGRAVERLWLTATSQSLSLQPLTGVLFFKLRIIEGGEDEAFSLHQRTRILEAYSAADHIFAADTRHIAFMFRIGRGEAPSAHAARFPLEDVVTIKP